MTEIKDILDTITKDGSSGYKAENGRYHLYISLNCPFSQRASMARALKGLENVITMDIVHPINDKKNGTGWQFNTELDGCTIDSVLGKKYVKEVYLSSHPNYTGRISVPILFDKQTKKIVSNSSLGIMKMLNTEFDDICEEAAKVNLYPEEKKSEIEELSEWIMSDINSGVYGVAFAPTQEVYDMNVVKVFDALDKAEEILSRNRYLTGNTITGADVMLFCALIRFDAVYYSLFKCNKRPLTSYKNLWPYTLDICQQPRVTPTVNIEHIKIGYWRSFPSNPSEIVPIGPELDLTQKHGRVNK